MGCWISQRALLLLAAGAVSLPAASLFTAETMADGTLYSDQVARRAGDLITILVQETTSVSEKNKTTAKRDNNLNAAVKLLPGVSQTPAAVGTSAVDTLPALSATSSKDFKGQGDFEASGEVKATITARVLDVLDNGNLLIEGRRAVRVNEDTKTILITGIIRTADIQANNTVLSEKLHNFQVSIVGEGPLTRAQSQGILGTIADVLWPF
jgi:flagellar L-ring protein precursor FlgH